MMQTIAQFYVQIIRILIHNLFFSVFLGLCLCLTPSASKVIHLFTVQCYA